MLDDDSFSDVCKKLYTANISAMTQTLELVRPEDYIRAADLLERADKVLCMGQGGSMIIAMEAAHLFSTASGKYFAVTDSHMQMIAVTTAGENDVILFFSYSGATKDLVETLSYARERGLRTILVTHFANSPGAELADVTLLCGADESCADAILTSAARAAPASPTRSLKSTCENYFLISLFSDIPRTACRCRGIGLSRFCKKSSWY